MNNYLGQLQQYSNQQIARQFVSAPSGHGLNIKISLCASAIVSACDAYIQSAKDASTAQLLRYWEDKILPDTETTPVEKSKGWWLWKKTWRENIEITLSEDAKRRIRAGWERGAVYFRPHIPAKINEIRAVAAHHKPSMFISLEGEELALISLYLAPSEAFQDGNTSGRV